MPSGMSPEVSAAIARRQGAQPALNQVTPQSAQGAQVTPPSPTPTPSAPGPATAPQPKFQAQTQDDLIIMTLAEKLKNNDKLKKEEMKISAQPAAAPAPQAAPQDAPMPSMGGGGYNMSPGFQQPMATNQMQSDYGSGLGKDYSGLGNYNQGGF